MSESGVGFPRARPLSAGLWSLAWWVRREEHASSDSVSSAGSARTAASFAFVCGPAPPPARASPPPSPASDSYRRRVRDRSLRRRHERGLTLHRKYGLPRDEPGARTPPPPRRAASEAGPRPAHVPGKRRAPPAPPPDTLPRARSRRDRKRAAPPPPDTSYRARSEALDAAPAVIRMNSEPASSTRSSTTEASLDCKSEKYSKKEETKDFKPRSERSFFRQIFESKKRNSSGPPPTKLLPNISELDKQAAEIIELLKLRAHEQNNNLAEEPPPGDMWFCTRCLRKYNATVSTCRHCPPNQKTHPNDLHKETNGAGKAAASNSTQTERSATRVSGVGYHEKQKLREMLKEMKHSLPKKPKNEDLVQQKTEIDDTPTLRIGTKISNEYSEILDPVPSTSKRISETDAKSHVENTFNTVTITQPVVLMAPGRLDNIAKSNNLQQINGANKVKLKSAPTNSESVTPRLNVNLNPLTNSNMVNKENNNNINPSTNQVKPLKTDHVVTNITTPIGQNVANKTNIDIPLRISSLLNPVYVSKTGLNQNEVERKLFFSTSQDTSNIVKLQKINNEVQRAAPTTTGCVMPSTSSQLPKKVIKDNAEILSKGENKPLIATSNTETVNSPIEKQTSKPSSSGKKQLVSSATSTSNLSSNIWPADQHAKRRDLINQLEQSIVKGDEKAAAEAAVKLAQLRLACSVLSFSSHIAKESPKAKPSNAKPIINSTFSIPVNNETEKNLILQLDNNLKKPHSSDNSTISAIANASKDKQALPFKAVSGSTVDEETKSSLLTKKEENISNINDKPPFLQLSEPSTSRANAVKTENDLTSIEVWVEDRDATRGPIRLQISRRAVMGELRRQAETSLGLASQMQRWIIGRALCTDENTPLALLAGPNLNVPFYLCLVESETKGNPKVAKKTKPEASSAVRTAAEPTKETEHKATNVYSELVLLEQQALVPNAETFECGVCMDECVIGNGAVLRECVHMFCRICLSDLIRHCEEPVVSCPAMGCPGVLQEREIRALVSEEEYNKWLARGLAAAESGTRNAFHCRTRDCTGWAMFELGVRRFPCPVCKHTNCLPCQAIHEGVTCEQYQNKLKEAAVSTATASSETDEGTRALLDTLIAKGEALPCPECSAIITKKWGCDWVKCSACKTEICWVTRGRRWGPAGRGDTSAGCRCGVDGKRCHPSCGYCH